MTDYENKEIRVVWGGDTCSLTKNYKLWLGNIDFSLY